MSKISLNGCDMSETELLAQGLSNIALEPSDDGEDGSSNEDAPVDISMWKRRGRQDDLASIPFLVNAVRLSVPLRNKYGMHGGFGAIPSERVAQGAYFQVRKTVRTATREAAKYPRRFHSSSNRSATGLISFEAFRLEVEALTHPPIFNHPNIVKLTGLSWVRLDANNDLSIPVLYFDFADNGTLSHYLADTQLRPQEKLDVADQIAAGLQTLHICGITHGDLKMENVLVFPGADDKVVVKLADFSCSTKILEQRCQLRGGTRPWNAPEWRDNIPAKLLHAPDIYSFGLLIWKICLDGQNPYGTMDPEEIELRKRRDVTIIDADYSIDQYYRFHTSVQFRLPAHEIFDYYHLMVVMPRKALRACLVREPRQRDLAAVRAALDTKVAYGLEQPIPVVPKPQLAFWPSQARNYYAHLFDAPIYVRRMHLARLQDRLHEAGLSAFEKGDISVQLAFAYIDGFINTQDYQLSSRWLISSASLGHLPAQEISHRLLHFCDQLNSTTEDQLVKWLSRAAAAGSNIALRDLGRFFPDTSGHKFGSWEDRPIPKSISKAFHKYDMESMFMEENVLSLVKRSNEICGSGGIAALKFGENHDTLLHFAAVFCERIGELRFIISRAEDLDTTNKLGETALHLAMRAGNISHARLLILEGANVNHKDKEGRMPFHWLVYIAAEAGAGDLLTLFLDQNADVEVSASIQRPSHYRSTPREGPLLELAVMENRLDLVRLLLRRGVDPTTSSGLWTPILRCISMHMYEILPEFISYANGDNLALREGLAGVWDGKDAVMRRDLASFAIGSFFFHDRIITHGSFYQEAFEKTMAILSSSNLLPHDLTDAMWYAAVTGQQDMVNTLFKFHQSDSESRSSTFMRIFERSISQIGRPTALSLLAEIDESTLRERLEKPDLLHNYVRSLSPSTIVLEALLRISGKRYTDEFQNEGSRIFASALESGHYELATVLLRSGVKASALILHQTRSDGTQIHVNHIYKLIAKNNDLSVYPIRYLLEPMHPYKDDVPDFVVVPHLRMTSLHLAARCEEETVFDYILAKYHGPQQLATKAIAGWTALHFAAYNGNLFAVNRLCDHGAPLNKPASKDWKSATALDLCGSTDRFSDVERRTEEQWEHFMIRRFQIWLHLKSRGARHSKPKVPVYTTFLARALREAWCDLMVEVIQSLSKSKDYPGILNASLHKAALLGHEKLIERLVNLGATVNDRTSRLRTPLHTAVKSRHALAVRTLVLAGADQTARDKDGRTPVIEAFIYEDEGLKDYLLQVGSPNNFPTAVEFDFETRLKRGTGEDCEERVEITKQWCYFLRWREQRDGVWHDMSTTWGGSIRAAEEGVVKKTIERRARELQDFLLNQRALAERRKFSNVWRSPGNSDHEED